MSYTTKKSLGLAALLALTVGCGRNVLRSQEKKDAAEDATLALERHNETAAITTLESALDGDPSNTQLLSILALAYAQRGGVEPLQFAERVATNSADTSASGGVPHTGDYTALFSVMPAATTGNLADVDKSCAILAQRIPPGQLQSWDRFKLALYQTASFILHTKALDTNGDGKLTLDEILNLSAANADSLVAQLAAAAGTFSGASANDATQQKAGQTIAQFQAKINASAGTTAQEKLKNYLASSGAASQGTSAAAAQAAAQANGAGLDDADPTP